MISAQTTAFGSIHRTPLSDAQRPPAFLPTASNFKSAKLREANARLTPPQAGAHQAKTNHHHRPGGRLRHGSRGRSELEAEARRHVALRAVARHGRVVERL